jgi:tetratricopeptide (TPR) repeat protein
VILAQAKLPALKIDGKENSDVYLQSLDIQVEVTGNIASTRYTMVFKNKTNRILEGELTFPLPDERTVTHYALDINGKMRDAVPVEKAKATEVFEEIEQRRVDPGLLERVEGNNFRTRIYPIPSNGTRTISIGYEEELTLEKGSLHYRLPMAYPDSLEKFAVKATVWKSNQKPLVPQSEDEIRFDMTGENYIASLTRENYRPNRSLIFALPVPYNIPQAMMQPAQGSYYFLASVVPKMETRKKQWDSDLAIIWDVSLSGSQRNLQQEMEMLNTIFAEKKNADVHLYFLNNKLKKVSKYKVANGNWNELKSTLEKAIFDGGTDFSQINLNDIVGNEILFFSDGLSTLSDADFLKNAKLNRPVHCVVSSEKSDYSAMKLIAGKTKGKFVNINALSSEELKNELLNETLQFLGTEHGKTVREVYPSIATPVRGNFSLAGISNTNDTELTLLFGFGSKAEKRINVKLNAKNAGNEGNVYKIWAQKKIAELDLDYGKNRAELTELGQQFGIVTRNTSLIVLETISDYIHYGIMPPSTEPELRAKYQSVHKGREEQKNVVNLTSGKTEQRTTSKDTNIEAVDVVGWMDNPSAVYVLDSYANSFEGINIDRNFNDFLKDGYAKGGSGGRPGSATSGFNDGYAEGGSGGIGDMLGGLAGGTATESSERNTSSSSVRKSSEPNINIPVIKPSDPKMLGDAVAAAWNIKKWWNTNFEPQKSNSKYPMPDEIASNINSSRSDFVKDNDYLNKLTGKTVEDYQIYLKLRDDYANSPTFYFDMADWFYTHNDKETALRILTSIADLKLENASLYRLLGYRFKEYGEYVLEKFVCQKVIQWRPMEPQSYRDYALALADNGETQAALDSLYSLLTRPYSENIHRRSRGIEEAVVMEINRLIAKNTNLNASKIDKRLLINIPVDIRVVINWNMNNTDIDLHVKDPNSEECFFRNRETSMGGRISADNTGGYGPEQFLLKKAIKGKYQIYVNYYNDRQFTDAGPSTIMAEIFIKYADKTEQRKVVNLQMSKAKKGSGSKVEVAEFEF